LFALSANSLIRLPVSRCYSKVTVDHLGNLQIISAFEDVLTRDTLWDGDLVCHSITRKAAKALVNLLHLGS